MEIFAAIGGTAWTVFFFIVALSVIVFVHEYGHYIVGRWTGIHSDVFSLGFGPVLWSRVDRHGTRWQIAAVPFGGYVKFKGDADASSVQSSDTSGLSEQERRHTMTGAPIWARSATVAAGPLANFILTFALLAGLLLAFGIPREEPAVGAVRAFPAAGPSLLAGDVILALNGSPTPDHATFGTVVNDLPAARTVTYTVRRDGQVMDVTGPHPFAPVVGAVLIRSAAMDAGLQVGDVILRAGGQDVLTFAQLPEIVAASQGRPVALTVWRDGQTFDLSLTPRIRTVEGDEGGFQERYQIGIGAGLVFEPATRRPGIGEVVELAFRQMWGMAASTLAGIGAIVSGAISSCNLQGAIGMAQTMGDAARGGVETFLGMMAVLSLGVGLLNLLPVPVLDGGHLVFHAYEAITRRKPSDRALRALMTVGLTLVLGLMVFALSRDLTCV